MKNKKIGENPSALIETLKDDDTWNVNESIITLIEVETESIDWTLTLYCDNSGIGGLFNHLILTTNGKGNLSSSFFIPYKDNNNSRSIYMDFIDNTNSNYDAIINIFGIEAQV
jgi:hypothetical protein